jgi:hypothetical protein
MLSARDNYCPDQVTFSGAEPSHPTTVGAGNVELVVNKAIFKLVETIHLRSKLYLTELRQG